MPGKNIPEIAWRIFYDQIGKAHIGPTINGMLMDGHKLAEGCACSPDIETHLRTTIVIHKIIH
jgi:hypothetical protein